MYSSDLKHAVPPQYRRGLWSLFECCSGCIEWLLSVYSPCSWVINVFNITCWISPLHTHSRRCFSHVLLCWLSCYLRLPWPFLLLLLLLLLLAPTLHVCVSCYPGSSLHHYTPPNWKITFSRIFFTYFGLLQERVRSLMETTDNNDEKEQKTAPR